MLDISIEQARLHRIVQDSQVKLHQAHALQAFPTGTNPGKGSAPRTGTGSSGRSPFGTLKSPT